MTAEDRLAYEREQFKDHIATFTDYGKVKVLDFMNPATSNYAIRFLFQEDCYTLCISGDLGHLVAHNYNNMCYAKFHDFTENIGYFASKVVCHDRPFYEYDYYKARRDLVVYLAELDLKSEYKSMTDSEFREDIMENVLSDLNTDTGLGSRAYDILTGIDPDAWMYISDFGKEPTTILETYMLAFKLAQEQLAQHKEPSSDGDLLVHSLTN